MSVPTNTLQTYQEIGIKDSVLDQIFNVTPANTPLIDMVGKSKAINTLHEWLIESLAAVDSSNYQVEGDDLAGVAITQPTRIGNYTMISSKVAIVSTTGSSVALWGRGDEVARAVAQKTKELKRDMETLLTQNNASAVGNASTAREAGALECGITTNISSGSGGSSTAISGATWAAPTDGTQRVFTESQVQTVMQTAFSNSGEMPSVLMVGPFNRIAVDGFTSGVQRVINDTNKVDGTVGVYVTPFGALKVVTNIFQRDRTAFLLNPDYVKVAYLQPFSITDMAITGLQKAKKLLAAEYTLELRNEKTCGKVADLTTS